MIKKLIFLFLFTSSLALANDPLTERESFSSFDKLISKEEIALKIQQMASNVKRDYEKEGVKEVVIVALMKGAICTASDFMRSLDMKCTLETIRTASYGQNGTQRGELVIKGLNELSFEGKDLLVIDDIFDSGHTLQAVFEKLKKQNPRSIRSLVLLKKNVPHQVAYRPDYVLFPIENRFVIGYGMDYKELWRDLPDVWAVPSNL